MSKVTGFPDITAAAAPTVALFEQAIIAVLQQTGGVYKNVVYPGNLNKENFYQSRRPSFSVLHRREPYSRFAITLPFMDEANGIVSPATASDATMTAGPMAVSGTASALTLALGAYAATGSNLLTNGDFSSGTTGWRVLKAWLPSGPDSAAVVSGVLEIYGSASGDMHGRVLQTFTPPVAGTYDLTFWHNGNVVVRIQDNANVPVDPIDVFAWTEMNTGVVATQTFTGTGTKTLRATLEAKAYSAQFFNNSPADYVNWTAPATIYVDDVLVRQSTANGAVGELDLYVNGVGAGRLLLPPPDLKLPSGYLESGMGFTWPIVIDFRRGDVVEIRPVSWGAYKPKLGTFAFWGKTYLTR